MIPMELISNRLKALPRVLAYYLSGGENTSLQCIHRGSGPRSLALLFGLILAVALLLFPQSAKADHQRDCTNEPTDEIIAYGEVVRCGITRAGEIDVFRFQGDEGESVAIQVTGRGGGRDPCFQLREPDNTLFIDRCGFPSSIARGEFRLPKTGEYQIRVYARGHASTMTYELNLLRTIPPIDPSPISFQQNLPGEIDHLGGY